MQTDEKTKIIIEHVLGKKKKENLEVALDIIDLTQDIREEIIKPFLEKLQGFICEELNMSQWKWETELYDQPYGGKKHRSFGVSSKFGVLPGPVGISLSGNPTGNNLYIGVFSSPTNELFNESMSHLGKMLDGVFKPESSWKSNWWIWQQYLKSPPDWDYADWTNKDTLIKMHTDRKRVAKDIGKHLLRIIEEVKSVIDKWGQQNSPTQ
ncbi:MAG: hypothetical protein OXI59_13490 [Gemmatimonadota bacterium]|nr:hypothetical protein [Gemmatimonadota bacterium]